LSIPIEELVHIQPAIFCEIDDPTHLDRVLEDDSPETELPAEVAAAEASRKKANDDLWMFQCYPKRFTGVELFDHSVGFLRRKYPNKEKEYKISDYLDCEPSNQHQRDLLKLDYHDRVMGNLMADVGEGGVPLQKAAQCCLDQLGNVKSHSGFINNPERIQHMKMRLELQRLLGRASALANDEAEAKQKAAANDLKS
jgi:hypothetical protein